MKTRGLLVGMLLLLGMLLSAQPICRITHYDEFSGLSQRLVKQIVQDPSGMMWVATWNGLNRFDGYRFDVVKPRVGDGTGIYSDRVSDIKLAATGNLWCWLSLRRAYLPLHRRPDTDRAAAGQDVQRAPHTACRGWDDRDGV